MKKRIRRRKHNESTIKVKKLSIPRPDVLHGYLRHSEINMYLEYLQSRYNFVEVFTLGTTHEHRQLKAIEINWNSPRNMEAIQREEIRRIYNNGQKLTTPRNWQRHISAHGERNMVFIEGGTHAREWISISVALNCIYQLTEKHMRNSELLNKLRFFIVPVSNPDGYEYSWTKNRNWRKNRKPLPFSKHIGTDCNRNYDFHWENGPNKTHHNTYRGPKPFSEPETRALRNALLKYQDNLMFFLSLHSYAVSIMYPWGYCRELPDNWQQLQKLAITGRNAIKAYNGTRHYRVGSIASLTKRTISGSIVDYAFAVVRVPLALVMELPSAKMGFQPPPEAISPIGHESWFGIREMCKVAYDLVAATPQNDTRCPINEIDTTNVAPKQPTNISITHDTSVTEKNCNEKDVPESLQVKLLKQKLTMAN